ncbi:MAG: acyltransferase [Pseudomonadota bacterium]
MPKLPKGPLRGLVLMSLFITNTLAFGVPIVVISVLKILVPWAPFRRLVSAVLIRLAECWVSVNAWLIGVTQQVDWHVSGLDGLSRSGWYLVIANHRSWVDIVVLQTVLNRRIPFLKFFIKDSLKWVPVLGLAWWALDMPFMKRYSQAQLARNPQLRGTDLKATQRACAKFQDHPTSVINFVEGTRFTPEKQQASRSPYRHLLRPKAGGIAFVMEALGPILREMVDVTIVYPGGNPTFWDLCCGRLPTIVVDVQRRTLPLRQAAGDYVGDGEFRGRFQDWLGGLWTEKDERLATLFGEAPSPTKRG